ncbi:1174_t:CDS:2, partial [Ambispora leptoticha]
SVSLDDEQDLKGRSGEYMVQIIEIRDPLDLSELNQFNAKDFRWEFFNMESVKALNHLMHTSPSYKYFQLRDLILDPNTRRSLGGGFELWAGFFESFRPGKDSFYVNVNNAHAVFYEKKDLVTFLCEFLKLPALPATFNDEQQRKINKVLKHLKVRPLHRPNVRTKQSIERISSKKAVEFTFKLGDSENTTNVKEYFKTTYNKELKHPHMVEIQTRRDEVWPLECCEIVEGQRVSLKNLNGDQLAKMITFTAVLPKLNMEKILDEGIGRVLDFVNDPKLKDFGIRMDTRMTATPSRILDPPTIAYHPSSKDGEKLHPNKINGAWNLRGRKFFRSGIPLKYWFVLCCVHERFLSRLDVENFVVTLDVEKNYAPPITFIVVGKRHHVRANATDKNNTDNKGNCVPGTIIDQKITHPQLFDFYLYSHSSLQGTSRPAHYIVLHDGNKFDVDTLQTFTYKLCYNYQRATRSVSIPPPVYYAHLSAKHARTHVTKGKNGFELPPVLPSLAQNYPMYFM